MTDISTLDDLRKNIDRVDEVLVRLLNERARCACEIGRLKKELGVETIERPVERQELYTADEAFFTGTAANVAPICEIDHRKVGNAEIGPVTKKLSDLYLDVIHGRNPQYKSWCTPVY